MKLSDKLLNYLCPDLVKIRQEKEKNGPESVTHYEIHIFHMKHTGRRGGEYFISHWYKSNNKKPGDLT